MGVYVRGDIHGKFDEILSFRDKMQLNKQDSIIILGDAGICWRKDKKDMNYYIKEWEEYEDTPMLYFIDGNHENFDILKSLTIDDGEGIISKHIHWLTRGIVKEFNGKKCLFIGGAESLDKLRRTEHLSWWADESITDKDIKLIDVDKYDYVFTHTCPRSILNEYQTLICDSMFDQDEIDHTSEDKLELVKNFIEYNQWWFGHFHKNIRLDNNFMCLYDRWEVLE